MCLNGDKVRVTENGVRLLCARGVEFSQLQSHTAPLAAWFSDVANRFETKSL